MNQLEILLKLKNETQAGFAQLEKSVDAVRKQTNDLSAAQTSSAAAGLKFGAAIGVAFAGVNAILPAIGKLAGAMSDSVRGYAEAGSALVDLKAKLGVGVVEMQKMQFAAEQSGVDFGSLTTSLATMEKAASKTPEKFAQLGISFGQIRASSPDQLMRLISDGLVQVTDHNERARISTELFGRSGTEMLKMLTGGYRDLLKEAESTGLMTEEMAAKADKLDDTLAKLDTVTKNLQINLAEAFSSPEMIRFMESMVDLLAMMARNAEKVAFALKTIAMSGTNLGGDLLAWAMGGSGGGAPAPSAAAAGGSVRQYQTGKGFDATTKALAGLDGAFDKLLGRMAKDAEKAAKETEKAATKASGFLADYAREMSRIPQGAGALAQAVRESIADGANRAGYGPQITTELGGVTPVTANVPTIPLELPPIAQWIMDPQAAAWGDVRNHAEKATKSTFDFSQALQNIANVAQLSGSKLGKAIAAIAGGGSGIASGFDALKKGEFGGGLTGFLGKVGVIGGIASAGLSIFGSLFGGGKEKKEAAERARIEALEAEVRRANEERDRRIAGLTSAAGGFNSFARGGITDQASADRAGLYAGAIFGGQVKESGDVVGALKSIGPALSEMAAKAKEFGLNLSAGVSNLIGMSNVLEGNEGLSDQLSGLNQMMKGLGDAGMVTKDIFAAFGADASAVFQRLIDGGATGNQALTLMQPTLQQLYEGQKRHGFAVDETTQALLDEAKAQGIVGDQFMSANERIVELLGILIEAVGGTLPDAYKRAGDAAEDFKRRASGLPGPPGGGGSDAPADEGPGFATGTAFRNFGRGTPVTLHGEEAVLTRPQVDRLVSMAVAGAPGSSVPQGGGQPIIVHVVVDGDVMGTAIANTIQRGGPAGVAIQTALAGRIG